MKINKLMRVLPPQRDDEVSQNKVDTFVVVWDHTWEGVGAINLAATPLPSLRSARGGFIALLLFL
jgi:hypothetical protein